MLFMLLSFSLDTFKVQDLNYEYKFVILALYDNDNPLNEAEQELDKFQSQYPNLRFCKLDVSGESQLLDQIKDELKTDHLPVLVILHQEHGLYDYSSSLQQKSIKTLIDSINEPLSDDIHEEGSELDLLDAYESLKHQNLLILFVGEECQSCQKTERHARVIAERYNMPLFIINCNSKESEYFCARKSVRHVPWIKVLADGIFYDYDYTNKEAPRFSSINKVIQEVIEKQKNKGNGNNNNDTDPTQYTQKKEIFTREYYRQFPTKKESNGLYSEWPPRPDLDQLYERIEQLEKMITDIEKHIQ